MGRELLRSPVVNEARREARLVAEARGGSVDAVKALFGEHYRYVWKAAYRLTDRRALADDVTQEAFVRAFSSLDQFDAGRPLRPWLKRIAVNRAIDLLRQERRLHVVEPYELARVEVPYGELDRDNELALSVARLAAPRRAVIVLHYWLDYSLEEIAELLGVPLGTVASRLSRGLADLRSDLEVHRANSA